MARTARTKQVGPADAAGKSAPPGGRGEVRASSAPASRTGPVRPVAPPDDLWERIARKAYELYERGGRREGRALEDWLEAEATVMQELHEARE